MTMASADCECCEVPTTMESPVPVEVEECDCDCFDCMDCGECECFASEDEPVTVIPLVLCDDCRHPDAPNDTSECGPGAWHCRCGRACDGSACPGPEQPWERNVGPADRGAL